MRKTSIIIILIFLFSLHLSQIDVIKGSKSFSLLLKERLQLQFHGERGEPPSFNFIDIQNPSLAFKVSFYDFFQVNPSLNAIPGTDVLLQFFNWTVKDVKVNDLNQTVDLAIVGNLTSALRNYMDGEQLLSEIVRSERNIGMDFLGNFGYQLLYAEQYPIEFRAHINPNANVARFSMIIRKFFNWSPESSNLVLNLHLTPLRPERLVMQDQQVINWGWLGLDNLNNQFPTSQHFLVDGNKMNFTEYRFGFQNDRFVLSTIYPKFENNLVHEGSYYFHF